MTEGSQRDGLVAVVQASSVTLASVLFLPGMLVRVACQLLAAAGSGMGIVHRGFITTLGGEIEHISGKRAWSRLFVATVAGPLIIGIALLLPTIIRSSLLDVRMFRTISSDPLLVISRQTSWLPFVETFSRLGLIETMRLWFGVSCFYCCVPSSSVLGGAVQENRHRSGSSPAKLALSPFILFFQALRALDGLLTVAFAGAYLASGLIVLFLCWRLVALVAQLVL